MKTLFYRSVFVAILFIPGICCPLWSQTLDTTGSHARRMAYLDQIMEWLPAERQGYGRVSYLDSTFGDWLRRTGELPPDFSLMPSIHHLPDPLVIDEGGRNIPVTTMTQWNEQRQILRDNLQKYVTGTFPPPPDNLEARVLEEIMDGEVTIRTVELRFGPNHQAKLTLELMIPPGEGPFPAFLTQWNHRGWAQIAVRRGYIGCIYAGADSKDDTEDYSRIWAGEYDFTRLMRRAWGSFRAIDYLYTLPQVNKDQIALTGHSRNGKQSLMAAAFDERITAIIPSSGGTGAEVPWRYCAYQYDVEDIALLGPAQPSWLHPRLRFFIGREQKLPIDQNSFMALIAPRGLMLSTAVEETASNPWGIEKAYWSARKAYTFLNAEDRIALRYRHGRHGTQAEDIEAYVDFFDFVFGRSDRKPELKYQYVRSEEDWELPFEVSSPDVANLQPGSLLDSDLSSVSLWEKERHATLGKVRKMLGKAPAGVTNPGPMTFEGNPEGEEKYGNVIRRPASTSYMTRRAISPYDGFGDNLFGYLYYPTERPLSEPLPVVIYLHEYDYSKGFSSMSLNHSINQYFQDLVKAGFAVFAFDMIGFGSRQQEGLHFYDRFPHWSLMGKMVEDVKGAVDALTHMEGIDKNKIFITGYSLGGTVGLYAASLDDRIAGIACISGFTSMRDGEAGQRHIDDLSRRHRLIPGLGLFKKDIDRMPFDYDDLLASIAPRPVLVIAPRHDQAAEVQSVEAAVQRANNVFRIYPGAEAIDMRVPDDYNRFSGEMRTEVIRWLSPKK